MRFKTIIKIATIYYISISNQISWGSNDEWAAKQLARIEEAKNLECDERIKILGSLVRIKSPYHHINENQRIVQEKALALMLSTPGHAEYYAKRIENGKKKVLEMANHKWGNGQEKSALINEQIEVFAVLGQIPSPETIRVLGEYLYDSWGINPDAKPGEPADGYEGGYQGLASNAISALVALATLPIANPPVQHPKRTWDAYWTDLDAWKLWYEQIKAGTRTIRFEGDPQEYNLYGPVDRAKEPGTARLSKPLPADTAAAVEEAPPSSLPWPTLLAALAACGAGAWLVLRKTSAQSGT